MHRVKFINLSVALATSVIVGTATANACVSSCGQGGQGDDDAILVPIQAAASATWAAKAKVFAEFHDPRIDDMLLVGLHAENAAAAAWQATGIRPAPLTEDERWLAAEAKTRGITLSTEGAQ